MELSCSSPSAPKPLLSSLHSSSSSAPFRPSSVSFRRRPPPRRGCVCLFGLGVPELVVIAGVAALVFGPKKLPEIGRSIGKTVKSFQEAAKEFETELKKEPEENADSAGSLEEKPETIAKEEGKKEFEASGTKETA